MDRHSGELNISKRISGGTDMKENIETTRWADYLNEYTRRNEGRPTRLEVIGENGRDKGIEFEDAKAVTTILRFETLDA